MPTYNDIKFENRLLRRVEDAIGLPTTDGDRARTTRNDTPYKMFALGLSIRDEFAPDGTFEKPEGDQMMKGSTATNNDELAAEFVAELSVWMEANRPKDTQNLVWVWRETPTLHSAEPYESIAMRGCFEQVELPKP